MKSAAIHENVALILRERNLSFPRRSTKNTESLYDTLLSQYRQATATAARRRSTVRLCRTTEHEVLNSARNDEEDKYEIAVGQPRSSRFQRGFPAPQPRPITAAVARRAAIADAIIAYVSLASVFSKRISFFFPIVNSFV